MADTAIPATLPIACTLGPDDAKDRLAWIAELNRDALRSYERRERVLELHYARHAIERVREMVRREKDCCAFLTFGLHAEGNGVRLLITAPENAGAAADALFEQFAASGGGAAWGCGTAKLAAAKPSAATKTIGG